MNLRWLPRILTPDYTWPCPMKAETSMVTPPTPSVTSPLARKVWSKVHRLHVRFSEVYSSWFNIPIVSSIFHLPFGLIIKWSDRVRVEEVIAMQMARAAGMPVPRVLSYGEDPSDDFRPVSILMTRLPGWELINLDTPFVEEEEQPWFDELTPCVRAMREWKSPFPEGQICSVIGTSVSSQRVPRHSIGPFKNSDQLCDYLLAPASSHAHASLEEYEQDLSEANKLRDHKHVIFFTHGDLKAHNLLVDEEHLLSGFLDWESAGCYPEYWDFTTAMRFGRGSWQYQVMSILSQIQYATELEEDRALNKVTVDSYIGM